MKRLGRKVQSRECAMILLGCFIVCLSRNFWLRKPPKFNAFVINHNRRHPSTLPVNAYALKSTLICSAQFLIAKILRSAALAKVAFLVVQGISITMVHLLRTDRALHDEPMHENSAQADPSDGVKCAGFWRKRSHPIPLHQLVKIHQINDSDLSLCQWDKSVVRIAGLRYGIT